MGLFDIFKKKKTEAELGWRVGGMEDFMSLIRVYYQAVMASNLGISNLAMLPDLRVFKQTMKVQTVNNKLGLGEKNKCKKCFKKCMAFPMVSSRKSMAVSKRIVVRSTMCVVTLFSFRRFHKIL